MRRSVVRAPRLLARLVQERRTGVKSLGGIYESSPEEAAYLVATRIAPPITFVSDPSATSDIEPDGVEGVHGPCDLVVLLPAQRDR
jgi:L-lactate utilization protein LutC